MEPTCERSGGCCAGDQLRCGCGSLLARLVPGGVELKCRRCKRIVVVPLSEDLAANPEARARG